ncbi:hypothetical protein M7I_2506 [Glarea lozoyensis 74030]|uniref:Uncharacterized protein n=1 Tax=Glarea lozoyensis (strain ATCC 74030 / MF5533) TaxID=1104152 RepID=H0EIY5_GLAL7|nr:hypothetical protein M7I_2506 [Glarea lozoyensis 74030]
MSLRGGYYYNHHHLRFHLYPLDPHHDYFAGCLQSYSLDLHHLDDYHFHGYFVDYRYFAGYLRNYYHLENTAPSKDHLPYQNDIHHLKTDDVHPVAHHHHHHQKNLTSPLPPSDQTLPATHQKPAETPSASHHH